MFSRYMSVVSPTLQVSSEPLYVSYVLQVYDGSKPYATSPQISAVDGDASINEPIVYTIDPSKVSFLPQWGL